MLHKPVLPLEAIESLHLRPGAIVVDGTLGSGGHSAMILEKIGNEGRLIAIDQDLEAIERCRKKFGACQGLLLFEHGLQRNE